jgi:uncharacterized cupin superfamily protein
LNKAMSKSIVVVPAESAELSGPATLLPRSQVLEGEPKTRSREFARSKDGTFYAMIWDCTAGRFNWGYNKDESLVVLTGEAFISWDGGEERRIAPGDTVFFRAGTSARWRVPNYIRKVAFLRHTMPKPAGYGVLAWNYLLRKLRGGGGGL